MKRPRIKHPNARRVSPEELAALWTPEQLAAARARWDGSKRDALERWERAKQAAERENKQQTR